MASFNIWGACVSRDILQEGVLSGDYEVKKWISFVSPITIFTEPYNGEFDVDKLPWGTDFFRRNLKSDLKKNYFEYLFSEESDYIIVDIIDCRMDIIRHEECMLTMSNEIEFNWEYIENKFGHGYWEHLKHTNFSEAVHGFAAGELADIILDHYSPDKIIYHIHYGYYEYIKDNSQLIAWDNDQLEWIRGYNHLINILNDVMLEKFDGCHVIEFPENVIGDGEHKWGLLPFHYHKMYYEYGGRAIDIIINKDTNETEKLEVLRKEYSDRFDDLRKNL